MTAEPDQNGILQAPERTTTDPMDKLYISANQLLEDSWQLAFDIIESGYRPDLLLGLWRGGAPVAIAIQEVLSLCGVAHQHYPVVTRHYAGIDNRHPEILIEGLEYALGKSGPIGCILVVDDIHDTGLSASAVTEAINAWYGPAKPEIRVAAPYFKPGNNRTASVPDYYCHCTEQWVVFPHELKGLSPAEQLEGKPPSRTLQKYLQKRP